MNEITVYNSIEEMERDRGRLRSQKRIYIGYVYAVEFGDHVKIGCTDNPINRIHSLASMARNYCFTGIGRIAVSPAHANYRENEFLLHTTFSEKRIESGELFDISFESSVDALSNIKYKPHTSKTKDDIKRLFEIVKNPSTHPMFREVALFSIRDYVLEILKEYKEKTQDISRLKSYAPKGTETFFNLISGYNDKIRHAIYEKMMSFSIEKQKRILGKIFREKTLPDFLKTIAEGE
jgi:hypothetical protein